MISGTQSIPPGGDVREHAHAERFECVLVLCGYGSAFIDGKIFPMETGTSFAIAPKSAHRFRNDGDTVLKLQWTISREV